jgi:hypothetical protein
VRHHVDLTRLCNTSVNVTGVNVKVYFWVGVLDVVSDVGVDPVVSGEEGAGVAFGLEEFVSLLTEVRP